MDNETEERRPVLCPWCASAEVKLTSAFGQSLLSSTYYCAACHSAFESVRWGRDLDAATASWPGTTPVVRPRKGQPSDICGEEQ